MIRRVMLLFGMALSAGLYFAEDRGVVGFEEPEPALVLPAETTTPVVFRVHNTTRRAVRVIGLAPC